MPRYPEVRDGEWIAPKRKGYKLACCDCGLIHSIDFHLLPHGKGKRIVFRARRLKRATAVMRSWKKRRK